MSQISHTDLSQPVSRFMTPVETTLRHDMTVAEALAALRERTISRAITYFYIIDQDGRLVGVAPSRALLLGAPLQTLDELMQRSAVSIRSDETLEEAMELFAQHRLLALPVVDADGGLVGQLDVGLYAEEALDLGERHRVDDLFQLLGVSVGETRGSALAGYRARMPWLLCNIVGGAACALIASLFHELLARVVMLAVFIPLVLTLSEAVSMQAVTLGLPLLRPKASLSRVMWRLRVEWRVVALIGASCAVIAGAVAMIWGQWLAAATIAAAVAVTMLCAATIGAVVPAALHGLRLDPKVAAGPVVLMVGDVVTTAVYLGLGLWWLS
jgi:magnesium transporter